MTQSDEDDKMSMIKLDPNMKTDWEVTDNIRFDLKTTTEIHDTRMETCKACDQLNKFNFCRQCGCFMPLKTWLNSSNCPLNKW